MLNNIFHHKNNNNNTYYNKILVMLRNISTINYHHDIIKHVYFKPLIAWILWIITGTIFYSSNGELGWSKGFYMAVNVGYSIGH